MTKKFIEKIDTSRFEELITSANCKIYLSLPNIHEEFADAILKTSSSVPEVRVILDIEENNFRNGYGDIKAIEKLKNAGIKIFECPKNRVSFIVCDDDGYFLFVESRIFSYDDIGNNAVKIDPLTQAHLIEYYFPTNKAHGAGRGSTNEDNEQNSQKITQATQKYVQFVEETIEDIENPKNTIEVNPINPDKFEEIKTKITINPPTHPDLLRQVSLYTAKIQFVELEFEGANLHFKKVTIPPKAMPFQDEEIKKALETKMRIFTDLKSNEHFKTFFDLKNKIEKIRRRYLTPITSRGKSIVKLDKKESFLKEINSLNKSIAKLNKSIPQYLDEQILISKERIEKELKVFLTQNPPTKISGYQQPLFEKKIDDMVSMILHSIRYPDPHQIVSNMSLQVNFYDLTFEDFKNDRFLEELVSKKIMKQGEMDEIVSFRKAYEVKQDTNQ